MSTFYNNNLHYFYLLPFQKSRHFKIGITSGLSYSRLRVHLRKFSIDPKETILVFGDEREVSDLEWFIKKEFLIYNRACEVKAIYGPFDGYTEVLCQDCMEQVKSLIDTWKQNLGTSLSVIKGLNLKNIYTDNNIDCTDFRENVMRSEPLTLSDLYQRLKVLLNTPQVSRVNFGFNKKVSYFGLQYLIEAEEGFENKFFDSQFSETELFKYGSLDVQHIFRSGQKLRSGATYVWGRINLVQLFNLDQANSRTEEINAINAFFEAIANHSKRDENFKVKDQYSIRNKFVANFHSYELGQKVRIGTSIEGPDSFLW